MFYTWKDSFHICSKCNSTGNNKMLFNSAKQESGQYIQWFS